MIQWIVLVIMIAPAAQAQFGFAGSASECQTSCTQSGAVQVDLAKRCMCIKTGSIDSCFKISIGKNGPSMTTEGRGKMHPAEGAKYQTKPGNGSTVYDNDAIAMGIPGNDSRGKWIHKTRNCSPGGGLSTKGCVAVPCDKWPVVKHAFLEKNEVVVCGGGNSERGVSPPQYGGESDYNPATRNPYPAGESR
jgi:hypothetical protein